MKIRTFISISTLSIALTSISGFCCAQNSKQSNEKEIYIPKELRNNDFNNPESKWSYDRMATTENFVIFWERDSEKIYLKPLS
jgi:hypothetical protein